MECLWNVYGMFMECLESIVVGRVKHRPVVLVMILASHPRLIAVVSDLEMTYPSNELQIAHQFSLEHDDVKGLFQKVGLGMDHPESRFKKIKKIIH